MKLKRKGKMSTRRAPYRPHTSTHHLAGAPRVTMPHSIGAGPRAMRRLQATCIGSQLRLLAATAPKRGYSASTSPLQQCSMDGRPPFSSLCPQRPQRRSSSTQLTPKAQPDRRAFCPLSCRRLEEAAQLRLAWLAGARRRVHYRLHHVHPLRQRVAEGRGRGLEGLVGRL